MVDKMVCHSNAILKIFTIETNYRKKNQIGCYEVSKKNVFNVASSYIKTGHFHIIKRYALYNL